MIGLDARNRVETGGQRVKREGARFVRHALSAVSRRECITSPELKQDIGNTVALLVDASDSQSRFRKQHDILALPRKAIRDLGITVPFGTRLQIDALSPAQANRVAPIGGACRCRADQDAEVRRRIKTAGSTPGHGCGAYAGTRDWLALVVGHHAEQVEIAVDPAELPGAVITQQVTNGIAVRMAVLFDLLGSGSTTDSGAGDTSTGDQA